MLDRFWSLRLAAMFAVLSGIGMLVSLPLSYYSGYVLEHRFHLSTLTLRRWLWRKTKMLLVGLPLGLAMVLGLFWILWTSGPWWWLVAAAAFFLVGVVLAQIWPVLIEPLFYTIERLTRPDLEQRLASLAQGTGLSIGGVYRIALSEETVKANAHLAGLGSTRRVLLGDTLLAHFTPDEIAVIFAHELGHHVFRHIRKLLVGGAIASALVFWLCDLALRAWMTRSLGAIDYAAMPVYALPLVELLIMAIQLPLGPLANAVSRHFERQSDRYALLRTSQPDAFITAFRKLARQNKSDPDPPRWEVLLFYSHPPIRERIAMAEQP